MPALPKRRHSTRRSGKRRADKTKELKLFVPGKCRFCNQPKLPYTICPNCKKY